MDKVRGALSTGYGFVEFSTPAHAVEALKKLQGMEVDNHVLELKFSKKSQGNTLLGLLGFVPVVPWCVTNCCFYTCSFVEGFA